MAKSKTTGQDFASPSHQPQSMWGDERGGAKVSRLGGKVLKF